MRVACGLSSQSGKRKRDDNPGSKVVSNLHKTSHCNEQHLTQPAEPELRTAKRHRMNAGTKVGICSSCPGFTLQVLHAMAHITEVQSRATCNSQNQKPWKRRRESCTLIKLQAAITQSCVAAGSEPRLVAGRTSGALPDHQPAWYSSHRSSSSPGRHHACKGAPLGLSAMTTQNAAGGRTQLVETNCIVAHSNNWRESKPT